MELIYVLIALVSTLIILELYNCIRNIQANNILIKETARIAEQIHRETNETLRLSRGGIN